MRFCSVCDNMLYISLGHAGTAVSDPAAGEQEQGERQGLALQYWCKHCGQVETDNAGESAKVMQTNYGDDQAAYKQYMTPYIRHDPTLPRKSNIQCAAPGCTKPKDAPSRVIYIKYDVHNLRYLYHCEHCGKFWKSGDL